MVTEAHCSCNKGRIISVSCIPIAPIKDPNSLVVFYWKASKEADEPDLVVDLTQSEQ